MNKILNKSIIYTLLLFYTTLFSQVVSVNTSNPLGLFHVDGKGDNSTPPLPEQKLNDFVITKDGNVGIGTVSPTSKLHISSTSNPLKIEGLTLESFTDNKILLIDKNNNVKKADSFKSPSFPKSAFFYLEKSIPDFFDKTDSTEENVVPMTIVHNVIEGLTYDNQTSTVTFPEGVFEISLTFDVTHNKACSTSSYFINFPFEDTLTNIHRTNSHLKSGPRTHTITVTYVTSVPKGKIWTIKLGNGITRDCFKLTNLVLNEKRTQLFIYKLGD